MLELSARTALIDAFMVASHGDLKSLGAIHDRAMTEDPLLYGPLARWYQDHGAIRDHNELFVAHSLVSPYPELRENGLVLLQRLRPYQVARVVRYLKETVKNLTRIARTAVKIYLQRREEVPEWFDECVIRDQKSMKYLYATLRIKPGPRAEETLFQQKPPEDSRVAVARSLYRWRNEPAHQAELIRKHHIQFTTARGAIANYTPSVLEALVEVMTPPQLITNLSFIEKRGGLAHERIRRTVLGKLEQAVTESRVAEFKALVALQKVSPDPHLADKMMEMVGQRLRGRGRIKAHTALLVDKSGSMQECIEIGRLLAALCSTICDSELDVEAFDSHSFTVKPDGTGFKAWAEAFRRIRAAGATSIGVSLAKLKDRPIEQVVLVSDGEENTQPLFLKELKALEERQNRSVKVIWIRVGGTGKAFWDELVRAGVNLTVINFTGDYYNLPSVVPMLCAGEHRQLVDEVLACPLYQRGDIDSLPPQFDPETYEIL